MDQEEGGQSGFLTGVRYDSSRRLTGDKDKDKSHSSSGPREVTGGELKRLHVIMSVATPAF